MLGVWQRVCKKVKLFTCSIRSVGCTAYSCRDLLRRHSLLHGSPGAIGPEKTISPYMSRVATACHACSLAKAKCSETKPCQRCQKRGIECVSGVQSSVPEPQSPRRSASISGFDFEDWISFGNHASNEPDGCIGRSNTRDSHRPPGDESLTQHEIVGGSPLNMLQGAGHTDSVPVPSDSKCIDWELLGKDNYFPSSSAHQTMALFGDGLNDGQDLSAFAPTDYAEQLEDSRALIPGIGGARQAFEESPWFSKIPTIKQHAPRQSTSAFLDRETVALLSDARPRAVPQLFDQHTRDRLLAMAAREERHTEPSIISAEFPSAVVMDFVADLFLRKQNRKLDSWLHTSTFDPASTSLELTYMILAAGTLSSPIECLYEWAYCVCKLVKRCLLQRVSLPACRSRSSD